MRIGLVLPLEREEPIGSPPWAIAVGERAEAMRLDSVWAYDHFFANTPDEPPRMPVHEAWTIVSAVAARTSRVEIGQLVMCTAYRPPALLAKMAATADAISGGRITLGLGAGWHFEEYRAFGYPFDHRFERFEETVRIIAPLVRGDTVTFDGTYHRADEAVLMPLGRSIPILIAAFRPRSGSPRAMPTPGTRRGPACPTTNSVGRSLLWTSRSTRRAEILRRSAGPSGSIRGSRRRTRATAACSSTNCRSSSRRTRRWASTMSSSASRRRTSGHSTDSNVRSAR
jgi:hypothetical protein